MRDLLLFYKLTNDNNFISIFKSNYCTSHNMSLLTIKRFLKLNLNKINEWKVITKLRTNGY